MRGILCQVVDRQRGCELIGAAASAEEAVRMLRTQAADLVLVDVSLPRMSGVDLVRLLQVQIPGLLCLMVSGHDEAGYARQALHAGARGYVLKGRPEDLRDGIRTVLDGGTYLSEPLREKLARDIAS